MGIIAPPKPASQCSSASRICSVPARGKEYADARQLNSMSRKRRALENGPCPRARSGPPALRPASHVGRLPFGPSACDPHELWRSPDGTPRARVGAG